MLNVIAKVVKPTVMNRMLNTLNCTEIKTSNGCIPRKPVRNK